MNALKHGLAGDALTFAEGRPEEFEARMAAWRGAFRLENDFDEWMFKSLVAETIRGEHCKRIAIVIQDEYARRADETWENDCREIALKIAENLSRKPALTRVMLLGSKHGCELLIEHWEGLKSILETDGDWDDSQKSLALDLLGVDPRLRSGYRLFKSGTPDADLSLFQERVAFIDVELENLRDYAQGTLEAIDAGEIECARAGVFFNEPKMLANVRRYERESTRRQNQILRQLRRQRRSPQTANADESKTATGGNEKPRRLTEREPAAKVLVEPREVHRDAPPTKNVPIPDLAPEDVAPADDRDGESPMSEFERLQQARIRDKFYAEYVRAAAARSFAAHQPAKQ